MRRAVLTAGMVAGLWACSSGSKGTSTNTGPAKAVVDQSALLFGLATGNAVPIGTQPANSVQVFNSGSGTVTISGATIGPGASTVTQQLPLGPGGMIVTSTLQADNSHPSFFTASAPSANSVSGTDASVIQVVFAPTLPGVFTATLSIATSTGTLSVDLAGEAVGPVISASPFSVPFEDGGRTIVQTLPFTDGGADISTVTLYADAGVGVTVPTVYLYPAPGDDGGPLSLADGGPAYATGDSSSLVAFYNVGTDSLTFQTATLDPLGDAYTWLLCVPMPPAFMCPSAPMIPSTLVAGYSDGGPQILPRPDGGEAYASSYLRLYFRPSAPGVYTQTATVSSDATNLSAVNVSISGTAIPAH